MLQLQFILLPIVAGVLFLIVIACAFGWWKSADSLSGWGISTVMLGVGFVGVVIVWLVLMIPYDSKYWVFYHESGTVAQVTNQWSDGSGDLTYRSYLVQLEGDSRPYLLDDPRTSQIKGKHVDLTCTIEFVYMGADRWNCVIGEVR